MRFSGTILAGIILLTIAGCNSTSSSVPPVQPTRDYTATASVGDLLTVSLDSDSKSIAYQNWSNHDSGKMPYSVNSDGTYSISDPTGNLIKAYEVPGHFMMMEANKVGTDHMTRALITAVVSVPISISDGLNKKFNYMEFRTSNGGFTVGSAGMDSMGNITISGYFPFGDNYLGNPFDGGTYPAESIQQDPSGNFLKVANAAGGYSYIFGTQDAFVADRPNGTILGFTKAATKEFDPLHSGKYRVTLYEKLGASGSFGTIETGAPAFDDGLLTVSVNGQATLADSHDKVLAQGMLTPVADKEYLVNGGIFSLDDSCFGLFTFRVITADSHQDLFIAFQGKAAIVSVFQTKLPLDPSNKYDYFYGVALQK